MKKLVNLLGACVLVVAGASATQVPLTVSTDRPDCLYRCGERAVFTVQGPKTNVQIRLTLDNFGTNKIATAVWNLAETNAFSIAGTMNGPGFLRLVTSPQPLGPVKVWSVAFEPEKIRKGSPSPADFDAYWAGERARLAREVPPDPQLTRIPERCTAAFDFYRISFATFGRRVYGYLSVPTDKSKAPYPVDFEVNAAGFGDWTNNMGGRPDAICMRFSVYPFEPDWKWKEKGLVAKYDEMNAAYDRKYACKRYCTAGLSVSREAYFFHPVILGIDRAVDWVVARPDVDRTRIRYQGTSQGGGFGFYLTGLNHAFTRAAFYVPAITDTMGCLKGRQSGWPQPIENNAAANRAVVEKWAPYFDGANFAARIRCPVRVAVGFSDTTCAPCAVYAAFNEIPSGDKKIIHGLGMTHGCFGRFYNELGAWVRDGR